MGFLTAAATFVASQLVFRVLDRRGHERRTRRWAALTEALHAEQVVADGRTVIAAQAAGIDVRIQAGHKGLAISLATSGLPFTVQARRFTAPQHELIRARPTSTSDDVFDAAFIWHGPEVAGAWLDPLRRARLLALGKVRARFEEGRFELDVQRPAGRVDHGVALAHAAVALHLGHAGVLARWNDAAEALGAERVEDFVAELVVAGGRVRLSVDDAFTRTELHLVHARGERKHGLPYLDTDAASWRAAIDDLVGRVPGPAPYR